MSEAKRDLAELGLRARVTDALGGAGIVSTADLVSWTPASVLAINGVGRAALSDIESALRDRGLDLTNEPGELERPDVACRERRKGWLRGRALFLEQDHNPHEEAIHLDPANTLADWTWRMGFGPFVVLCKGEGTGGMPRAFEEWCFLPRAWVFRPETVANEGKLSVAEMLRAAADGKLRIKRSDTPEGFYADYRAEALRRISVGNREQALADRLGSNIKWAAVVLIVTLILSFIFGPTVLEGVPA